MPEESFMGRRLFAPPTLWQDWGDDPETGDVSYWELFVDLLLVAAASSLADTLRGNLSLSGVIEFGCLYMVVIGGWILYTHHYTSRFNDASLTHSLLLFLFLVGMAVTVVNASYEHVQYFGMGLLTQRIAFLIMLHGVYATMYERCGVMVRTMAEYILINMVLYGVLVAFPSAAWCIMPILALLELLGELTLTALPRSAVVPINIEHSKDRLGVSCLVMIGETIISITMEYREHMEAGGLSDRVETPYYTLLALAFLLVFMFTLLYFNMQPPPALHAFRRSLPSGWSVLVLHKLMGLSLLAVGVAIKVAVSTVVEEEELTPFASRLLGIAVGTSLLNLFAMRLCHFGFRRNAKVSTFAYRVMCFWWLSFGVFSVLPFFYMGILDPVQAFLWQSLSMAVLCVLETCFTHILETQITANAFLGIEEEDEQPHEGTGLIKAKHKLQYH